MNLMGKVTRIAGKGFCHHLLEITGLLADSGCLTFYDLWTSEVK